MDKNAIKKYAVWARRELISRVSQKAVQYGITEGNTADKKADSVNGILLSKTEKEQRTALINRIEAIGYQQTMEEAAYTWFNRFSALRYMEVNGYLPTHIRVFTDDQNAFKPQILAEAIHLELDGLNMDKVYELKDANKTDELYKYLLITQCNAFSKILPGMFTRIADYTELLFPDNLLREGSVIEQMISMIPEDDWKDAVQIIGWLYQYYNAEPKDKVFADLKKNIKISKENIPAATQLFTPDWIVRYMVENSLGRIFVQQKLVDSGQWSVNSEKERIAKEKEIAEKMGWKYYLPEAEQEPEVRAELTTNHSSLSTDFNIENIKVIDPCMGSGHILVYMFDVLVQIYESYGYNAREAAGLILQNNLYGLDIDDRAAQLAYFAVMMKARQYDRRIFSRDIQPHVYAIVESNGVSRDAIDYFEDSRDELKEALETIVAELHDAKEYGSILNVTQVDFAALYARLEEIKEDISLFATAAQSELRPLIEVAEAMAQKYHTVVTNPPYMANGGFSPKLDSYIKKYYLDCKSDLYAVFIKKCLEMARRRYFIGMITQHSWMFISSYEKLRYCSVQNDVVTMAHLGPRAFEEIAGEVVQTTAYTMRRTDMPSYVAKYSRLVDYQNQSAKEVAFLAQDDIYCAQKRNFSLFPGNPYVYWVGDNIIRCFTDFPPLGEKLTFREGIHTADNDRFLRLWHEVLQNRIVFNAKSDEDVDKNGRWVPYNKGGKFRKWYGNNEYIIGFDEIYRSQMAALKGHVRPSQELYYKEGGTWTAVASGKLGIRYYPTGYLFDAGGQVVVGSDLYSAIAVLNTKVYNFFADMLMPTLNYKCGMLKNLPDLRSEKTSVIEKIAKDNIAFSKEDWDSFETSWDFKRHPLVSGQCLVDSGQSLVGSTNHFSLITNHYTRWENECNDRFNQLKKNEEELNATFIEIYGLQDELTPDVDEKDVTVRKADLGRDIRSLISYAVGCMFGRYSLDCEGLAYAGGDISGQWVVVSGQDLVDSGQWSVDSTNHYYDRKVVEYYVSQELSRVNSLAKIYEFDGRNISSCKETAERGTVCTVGSNAQGGSVNPFQYCRGTGEKLYEGIRELSINSERLDIGVGNTAYDLCSPEILDAISNGNGNELVSRGWKDANRIDWQTIHSTLTTNHYNVDIDNIIPICDDDYFDDDITGRFIKWVEAVYGKDTLEDNLKFIADALTTNHSSLTAREIIRKYFLNDFYADHCKIYQKRPIYWLFDSGKKNGFKALIYMHRYKPDTIARMRTDYVHEQQSRYRTAIADLQQRVNGASTGERVKLTKQLDKLTAQTDEIRSYEEKIHHLADMMIPIDLDNGVKVNYAKFADVLAKIK